MSSNWSLEPGLASIPYVVVAVYLVTLLGLGWLGYRRSQIGEEDYYLAGRGQGWVITSLTIMASFFSSFALLGAPGMVYREGVVFALVSLNVPVAGYCVYLLGSRIWEAGRAHGYVTPADMICDYYGSRVALRLLVVLVGILFTIPYVMMQLKAGGELAAVMFDSYAGAFDLGAVVLAGITTLYFRPLRPAISLHPNPSLALQASPILALLVPFENETSGPGRSGGLQAAVRRAKGSKRIRLRPGGQSYVLQPEPIQVSG